ncbi:MAG: hypothetical protein IAF38_20060 [Bacteroidia bacterium]|nr:hypothetical protein [Bacteroidia bacterium]
MFTKEELIEKYKDFSTEKLVKIASSSESYTAEAIEAANELIDQKGGREALQAEIEENKKAEKLKILIPNETKSIFRKVKELYKSGLSEEEIQNQINAEVLGIEKTKEIVTVAISRLNRKRENQRITNKTIGGCVIGGLAGFLLNTFLFCNGFQTFNKVPNLIYGAFVLINYAIIYLITRQSFKNVLILIVCLSMAAASMIAGIFVWRYIF